MKKGRSVKRTTVLSTCIAASLLLSVSACGGDGGGGNGGNSDPVGNGGGKHVRPPSTIGGAGRGGESASAAPAEDPTQEPSQNPSQNPSQDEVPLPVYLYPNGREVVLTAPGSTLVFGDAATVATADEEGRLLVWSITAHDGVPRGRESVRLLDPLAGEGVDHYLCFAFDIVYLGAVPRFTDDPVVLTALPDTTSAVPTPMMVPMNRDGLNGNQVVGSVDDGCGIPPVSRLPVSQNELVAGRHYARGVLSHAPADPDWPSVPVGLRFDYGGGVPGASDDRTQPASVTWR